MNYDYNAWHTRVDATGKKGIRSRVNVLACLWILGTDRSIDDIDDSVRMARQTIRTYFHEFSLDVIALYGSTYFNVRPMQQQLSSIETKHADVGFDGYVGSVDC